MQSGSQFPIKAFLRRRALPSKGAARGQGLPGVLDLLGGFVAGTSDNGSDSEAGTPTQVRICTSYLYVYTLSVDGHGDLLCMQACNISSLMDTEHCFLLKLTVDETLLLSLLSLLS